MLCSPCWFPTCLTSTVELFRHVYAGLSLIPGCAAGDAVIAEVLDLIAWQTPLKWSKPHASTEDVWPPVLRQQVSCPA